MATAFKCDGCKKFVTGVPDCHVTIASSVICNPSSIAFDMNMDLDLCKDCEFAMSLFLKSLNNVKK